MQSRTNGNRGPKGAVTACLTVALLLLTGPVVRADYVSGFEGLVGSWSGEPLTGQDGYYLPPGTESVDFLVYTYLDNQLMLPENPTGGLQFIGGTGPAGNVYARAQRDMSFAGDPVWNLAYDFAAAYLGSPPSANNIGSFSLRNEGAAVTHYIHLMAWVDPATPTNFTAFFMGYDAAGNQHAQPGVSPGPAWENLDLNHWYRAWAKIDLDLNMFLEVGIIDLDTGVEEVFYPTDWYLAGGAGGASAMPESFRFFAGGSVAGNVLAFDNIEIVNLPPVPVIPTSWGQIKTLFR